MGHQLKRWLAVAAIAGGTLVVCALTLSIFSRHEMLVDRGQTRPAIEQTLSGLQALHPASLEDPLFRAAADQAGRSPFVAGLWAFAPDGRIAYTIGGPMARLGSAEEQATDETRRILAALPEEALSAQQRTWLLAASTIQAEGEHNDVYQHLLRPIEGPDGGVVGLIGVAYDVSPGVGNPGPGYIAGIVALLAGAAVYWWSLPAWVYLDARERGERALIWAAFVSIGNVVALIAYMLARWPATRARGTD